MAYLGLEIGGTKLQVVLGTAEGKICERARRRVDQSAGAAGIRAEIERILADWRTRFIWQAAGVGFGGPVDVQSGTIHRSHQIAGWDGFALQHWLSEVAGCPAVVENDANVAALAEARCGAGAGHDPVFYTNCGSGVGGGVVVRGEIYHGISPGEVEFGHLRLGKGGGTIEEHCSGWAIDRKVQQLARGFPQSLLTEVLGTTNGAAAIALAPALAGHCPIAQRVLHEAAEDLALGLSHAVHLFHPERIILGGGLSLLGEPWRKAVAECLPGFLMAEFQSGWEVAIASLSEDVVPIGALILAADAARKRGHAAVPTVISQPETRSWIEQYLAAHKAALDSISIVELQRLIELFQRAWAEDRQVFLFGNGGSAANVSHFSTDLGKGSSDRLPHRFRVISLNENISWMTALGNDYAFDEVFSRQLANYARPGDIALTMSVSGNSPNLVKAVQYCQNAGLVTVALVGQKRGRLAELADHVLVVDDAHYGRVEDAHMTIAHMLCYFFMEHAASAGA